MESVSRRELFVRAGLGLAVASGHMLRADAEPTLRGGEPVDYQALLATPLEPPSAQPAGRSLVFGGRVWAHDTRRPLAGAVVDVWPTTSHAAAGGAAVPGPRVRAVTDAAGRYEVEIQRPAAYRAGRALRPAMLYLMVRHADHPMLVTQVAFRGDAYLDRVTLPPALVVELHHRTVGGRAFEVAQFDIVLARR